jgi:hypothetical protein
MGARPSTFLHDVDFEAEDASYVEQLGSFYLHLSQIRWTANQLRASCLLYADKDGQGDPLFQADIDLISMVDRDRLLRLLSTYDRGNDPTEWPCAVHAFFARVIQHESHIETPICITSAPPRKTERYLTVGSMPLLISDFTMIFGDGGSKKSLISLWWAAQLSGPHMRVLWVDWEMFVSDHQERLATMFPGQKFPYFDHLMGTAPLEQMEDVLRGYIKARGIKFLVIDSAVAAAPGKSGAPADMPTGFFQTLRRLRVGALIIGHQTKSGDATKPFGSVFWHNSVRASWFVQIKNGLLTLTNRKDSHGGITDHQTISYTVSRPTPSRTLITPTHTTGESARKQILAVLSEQEARTGFSGLGREQLHEQLPNISKDNVRTATNLLYKQGLIKRTALGAYCSVGVR